MAKTTDNDDEIYLTGFDRERSKLLVALGVPPQDLPGKKMREAVSEGLARIETDLPRLPGKILSTAKQFRQLRAILANPLRGSYTLGISSFPSDQRAKHLAMLIMSAAVDHYQQHRRAMGSRSMPMWHRVFGSLGDNLRDKGTEKPCMLILSNVTTDSSNVKIEKVRDLLEKYSDIPRIVVTAAEPPSKMFGARLHYPMTAGFYLGPHNHTDRETT